MRLHHVYEIQIDYGRHAGEHTYNVYVLRHKERIAEFSGDRSLKTVLRKASDKIAELEAAEA